MPINEPTRRTRLDRLWHTLRRHRGPAPDLPASDRSRVTHDIEELLAERETDAQRAAADRLVALYRGLDATGRAHFVELVATDFGTDPAAVDAAASDLRAAAPGVARVRAERAL
ncbi:MAG TPA: hypothetical protein VFZ17_15165, partial [Acidimicrobiia bacterium]|nr:hypothetical protein [Acidimicrobiia bacterium]